MRRRPRRARRSFLLQLLLEQLLLAPHRARSLFPPKRVQARDLETRGLSPRAFDRSRSRRSLSRRAAAAVSAAFAFSAASSSAFLVSASAGFSPPNTSARAAGTGATKTSSSRGRGRVGWFSTRDCIVGPIAYDAATPLLARRDARPPGVRPPGENTPGAAIDAATLAPFWKVPAPALDPASSSSSSPAAASGPCHPFHSDAYASSSSAEADASSASAVPGAPALRAFLAASGGPSGRNGFHSAAAEIQATTAMSHARLTSAAHRK